MTDRHTFLSAALSAIHAAKLPEMTIPQSVQTRIAMRQAVINAVTGPGGGWLPIAVKPPHPMPVLYWFGRIKWINTSGEMTSFGSVRDNAERTGIGFWNDIYFCHAGTGHDVFEPWIDADHLPTHWQPLPPGPKETGDEG